MQWMVCCFGGKRVRRQGNNEGKATGTAPSNAAPSAVGAQALRKSTEPPDTAFQQNALEGANLQLDVADRALHQQPSCTDTRAWQCFLRDALVLERLAASVTILSLTGQVLHQNPGSRQLLGERVADAAPPSGALAAAFGPIGPRRKPGRRPGGAGAAGPGDGDDGGDGGLGGEQALGAADCAEVVGRECDCRCFCCSGGPGGGAGGILSVIFLHEPDKLEEMLSQLQAGAAVWRGVVRMPHGLADAAAAAAATSLSAGGGCCCCCGGGGGTSPPFWRGDAEAWGQLPRDSGAPPGCDRSGTAAAAAAACEETVSPPCSAAHTRLVGPERPGGPAEGTPLEPPPLPTYGLESLLASLPPRISTDPTVIDRRLPGVAPNDQQSVDLEQRGSLMMSTMEDDSMYGAYGNSYGAALRRYASPLGGASAPGRPQFLPCAAAHSGGGSGGSGPTAATTAATGPLREEDRTARFSFTYALAGNADPREVAARRNSGGAAAAAATAAAPRASSHLTSADSVRSPARARTSLPDTTARSARPMMAAHVGAVAHGSIGRVCSGVRAAAEWQASLASSLSTSIFTMMGAARVGAEEPPGEPRPSSLGRLMQRHCGWASAAAPEGGALYGCGGVTEREVEVEVEGGCYRGTGARGCRAATGLGLAVRGGDMHRPEGAASAAGALRSASFVFARSPLPPPAQLYSAGSSAMFSSGGAAGYGTVLRSLAFASSLRTAPALHQATAFLPAVQDEDNGLVSGPGPRPGLGQWPGTAAGLRGFSFETAAAASPRAAGWGALRPRPATATGNTYAAKGRLDARGSRVGSSGSPAAVIGDGPVGQAPDGSPRPEASFAAEAILGRSSAASLGRGESVPRHATSSAGQPTAAAAARSFRDSRTARRMLSASRRHGRGGLGTAGAFQQQRAKTEGSMTAASGGAAAATEDGSPASGSTATASLNDTATDCVSGASGSGAPATSSTSGPACLAASMLVTRLAPPSVNGSSRCASTASGGGGDHSLCGTHWSCGRAAAPAAAEGTFGWAAAAADQASDARGDRVVVAVAEGGGRAPRTVMSPEGTSAAAAALADQDAQRALVCYLSDSNPGQVPSDSAPGAIASEALNLAVAPEAGGSAAASPGQAEQAGATRDGSDVRGTGAAAGVDVELTGAATGGALPLSLTAAGASCQDAPTAPMGTERQQAPAACGDAGAFRIRELRCQAGADAQRPRQQQQQRQQQRQGQRQGQPGQPGQPEAGEVYHEVCAVLAVDPVTGMDVLVLSQHDVTAKVVAERHLALVMETEHRLLEQLFPRHVLAHLAEGAGPHGALPSSGWRPAVRDCNALATWHPQVTLLFADIEGFTPICKEVEPRAVMSMLNDLFSRFDANLDKFGVYKVETIGDCYFVAGGLLREDPDGMTAVRGEAGSDDGQHAAAVFGFAQAMLEAAAQVATPTTGEPVSLRIGLHSGPVVSGVVGTRMPRFCLFGDTVNTASRMESTGLPGAVHASSSTYELLRGACGEGWSATGGVEVKGKGHMQTFLWRP